MTVERCGHPKVDSGEPCPNPWSLCPECGFCWSHCPCRAKERKAAQRRGGRSTARLRGGGAGGKVALHDETPGPLETLEDAVTWAAWAARAVATGDLDTTRGNTVARLLKEFRSALERSEARDKLEEIRARVLELTGEDVGPGLEALK